MAHIVIKDLFRDGFPCEWAVGNDKDLTSGCPAVAKKFTGEALPVTDTDIVGVQTQDP